VEAESDEGEKAGSGVAVYGGNGVGGTADGASNRGIGAEEPRDEINDEKSKSGVTGFGREGNGKENTAIVGYLVITAAGADGVEGDVAVFVSGVGMLVTVILEEMNSSLEVPSDKTRVGGSVTVGISGGTGVLSTRQLAIDKVEGTVLGLTGGVQGVGEYSKNPTVEIVSMNA